MKTVLLFLLVLGGLLAAAPIELEVLPHKVLYDKRTFLRKTEDRRASIWTDDPAKAAPLLESLNIKVENFSLKKGELLAVFLNDSFLEDLTQIVFNKTANRTFADYAESGIEFKLTAPEEGMKYSHLTAVVFSSAPVPNLMIRGMQKDCLSEKE